MVQKHNNEKVFHVKKIEPKEKFSKIPNSFIDETILYLTQVEMKLLLIFMRSKDTYDFTMPRLAKRLGTNRENLYKVIKKLEEKRLLWKYKNGYELNPNPPIDDLKIAKSTERTNRIKGKLKAKKTIKKKQEQNATLTAVESTTHTVVKNTTPLANEELSTVVNSNTIAVVEDTTQKNELNPSLVDESEDQSHHYKTNDNNTNRIIISGNENNIEDNSSNLVKGNSLKVILQNSQFNEIYSHNLTSYWENTDISTFSDSYIAHIVIEKKIKNETIEGVDRMDLNLCYFLCQFSLKDETPPNRLAAEIISQLEKEGLIAELFKITGAAK